MQPWTFCLKLVNGVPFWTFEAERENAPDIEVQIISAADADYYDIDIEAIATYYEIPVVRELKRSATT